MANRLDRLDQQRHREFIVVGPIVETLRFVVGKDDASRLGALNERAKSLLFDSITSLPPDKAAAGVRAILVKS